MKKITLIIASILLVSAMITGCSEGNNTIVAVLIVGVPETAEDNPDVTASATTRNAFDDVVTLIK